MTTISIIIPVFNEGKSIQECLLSLDKQNISGFDVIIVDDGSTDDTLKKVSDLNIRNFKLDILKQSHLGPGVARNLGAENATGDILVFVDADMTFEVDFIYKLINPIINKETIGTFSKEEFVSNKDNIWSKCWNINKNLPIDRMHSVDYPNKQKVFRAILKSEFIKSGGFQPIGYIDDYTVSESLGVEATAVLGAIFYHRNPESFSEVFNQARWIGKSEYKRRKVKNEFIMKLLSLVRFSLPLSLSFGIKKSIERKLPFFVIFRLVYDFAIEVSLIQSLFSNNLYK